MDFKFTLITEKPHNQLRMQFDASNSLRLSNNVNKCWGVDDDAGDDAGAVVQFQHQLRLRLNTNYKPHKTASE